MSELKWVYGLDEIYFGEIFDTKEEAIQSAIKEIKTYNDEEISSFWLANPTSYKPTIYAEYIMEELQQHAYDFADEHSEGWLDGIPKEKIKQLENDLNKVLDDWITKNNYEPNFYRVHNAVEISVVEDEVDKDGFKRRHC